MAKKLKLKPGAVYAIQHLRKGSFIARLEEIVPADEGDLSDRQLLKVLIDTHRGSGQERLARSAGASFTVTNIRPSLVTRIEELPEEVSWKVQRIIPEPPPIPAKARGAAALRQVIEENWASLRKKLTGR